MSETQMIAEQKRNELVDKTIRLINRDRITQNIANAEVAYRSGCILDATKKIWTHLYPETELPFDFLHEFNELFPDNGLPSNRDDVFFKLLDEHLGIVPQRVFHQKDTDFHTLATHLKAGLLGRLVKVGEMDYKKLRNKDLLLPDSAILFIFKKGTSDGHAIGFVGEGSDHDGYRELGSYIRDGKSQWEKSSLIFFRKAVK